MSKQRVDPERDTFRGFCRRHTTDMGASSEIQCEQSVAALF